jgi:hypothetical protein
VDAETEVRRLVNSGVIIKLKKFDEEVTVKELSLEQVIKAFSELSDLLASPLLTEITGASNEEDSGKLSSRGLSVIVTMISDKRLLHCLKTVASFSTNRKLEEFDDLSLTDWFRWATAFKSVVDWEELKELFTQLGLHQLFQRETTDRVSEDELVS